MSELSRFNTYIQRKKHQKIICYCVGIGIQDWLKISWEKSLRVRVPPVAPSPYGVCLWQIGKTVGGSDRRTIQRICVTVAQQTLTLLEVVRPHYPLPILRGHRKWIAFSGIVGWVVGSPKTKPLKPICCNCGRITSSPKSLALNDVRGSYDSANILR